MRGQLGFTLIEVLIAVGIVGIVAFGTASLITNMVESQIHVRNRAALMAARTNLENLIRNPDAWANTLAQGVGIGLGCLHTKTDCSPMIGQEPKLVVWERALPGAASVAFYDPQTQGFSKDGVVCTGFPSLECPARFDLRWSVQCPTQPCFNPTVRVRGQLQLNAGSPESTARIFGATNPGTYSLDVFRASSNMLEGFVVSYVFDNTGEGPCQTTWVNRRFNSEQDPHDWVQINLPDVIQFRQAGTYTCTVTAPAFRAGSHEIAWRDIAGNVLVKSGAAYSDPTIGGNIQLSMEVKLVLTSANQQFTVSHRCSNPPAGGSPEELWSFGLPVPFNSYSQGTAPGTGSLYPSAGNATTYTVVTCMRTQ